MTSPAKKTVELFYDVVSPYSWIGFEVMCRYQSKWNIDLKLKPFFLGGVMNETGNRPPAMVPAKGSYMMKDIGRLARHFSLPLNIPANPAAVMFEKGTLAAMRFLTAVDIASPQHTEALSRQLWLRIWSKDEDVTQTQSFEEAGRAAGLSDAVIQDALSKSREQPVKDRLKQYTAQAIDYGAFGAPTIVAHVNEEHHLFFGADRFHVLADALGEKYEGPLNDLNKAKL